MAQTTPLTRNRILYSDFHKDLALLPGRGDLARTVNENSVRESIKNILLGSDIRATLFENATPITSIILRDKISDTLRAYEPRANLLDVEVTGDIDTNALRINVVFSVINNETPQTLSIDIDRVR